MPSANYSNRVLPSIKTLFRSDAIYRCERDLHHHLTVLFDQISSLRIGQMDSLVRYEWPSIGKYQWTGDSETSGNIDIFFLPNPGDPSIGNGPDGLAIEVNGDYPSTTKIKQDIAKLLDPENHFSESVYLVVGNQRGMKRPVELGYEEAMAYLASNRRDSISTPLRIVIVENLCGWRFLYEGSPSIDGPDAGISWAELDRNCLSGELEDLNPMKLLSKEEAKAQFESRMQQEGFRLTDTVVACMFQPTKTKDGRQLCHFGKSPLWDHVVQLDGESVTFIELNRWTDKLIAYGKSRKRK